MVQPGLLRCAPNVDDLFQEAITKGTRLAELSYQQDTLRENNQPEDVSGCLPEKILQQIASITNEKKRLGDQPILALPLGGCQLNWQSLWAVAEDWVDDQGMEAWFSIVLGLCRVGSVESLPVNFLGTRFPEAYVGMQPTLLRETASNNLRHLARQFSWGEFEFTYIPIHLASKSHWILLRIHWQERKAEIYNSRKGIPHEITEVTYLPLHGNRSELTVRKGNPTNDRGYSSNFRSERHQQGVLCS